MSLLKSMKAVWRRFAEQTTISGFHEILLSKHWLESTFWAALIIVGLCLTVRECEAPIRAYLQEATASIVELRRNDSISFPDASICVEIRIDLLTPKNATRLTDADSLKAFRKCLLSAECHRHIDFYDEFYDEIAASTRLLASFVVGEHGREHQIAHTNKVASTVPASFHRFLSNTNISATSLFEIITFSLCSKMEFKVFTSFGGKNEKSIDFCTSSTLSWFGVPPLTLDEIEHLCYTNANVTTFVGSTRMVKNTVSFLVSNIYPAIDDSFSSDFRVYVSLNDDRLFTDRSVNVVWFNQFRCNVMHVEVLSQIRSIDKRRRPCSSKETVNGCVRRCRASALEAYCNCTSVSRDSPPNQRLPSCFVHMSVSSFAKCGFVSRQKEEVVACEAVCKRESARCEAKTIRVEKNQMMCQSPLRENSTTIEIVFNQFEYLYCEELFSMELPMLMSNLGGIFGLWLGVGFIGIIHAITFPLKLGVEKVTSKAEAFAIEELGGVTLRLAELERVHKEERAAIQVELENLQGQIRQLFGDVHV